MSPASRPGTLARPEAYALALLLFAPLAWLFISLVADGSRSFDLAGDVACIESRVVNASQGVQYLGPYSRFRWNNLGPVYFYALLPLYSLFSMGTQSLYAGAALINIVSVLAILYCLIGLGDRRLFFFGAFCLAFYVQSYLGPHFVRNIWDPHVTVLAFAAFVFSCANLSTGRLRVLPAVVFAFTFLVQTRVGYAPVAVWMLTAALGLGVRVRVRERARFWTSPELWIPVGLAAALLAATWALPLAEALEDPPGNLGQVFGFFLFPPPGAEAGQTLLDALRIVSNITNEPFVRAANSVVLGAGFTLRSNPLPLFAAQIALALGALAVCHRRDHAGGTRLLLLSLSGTLICFVSATRIPGVPNIYLVVWMSVLGLIHWGAIGFTILHLAWTSLPGASQRLDAAFAGRWGRPLVYAPVIVACIALLLIHREGVRDASSFDAEAAENAHIGRIAQDIAAYVEREEIDGFLLKANLAQRLAEAGVFNQLQKMSVRFWVEDRWLFWAGYQFRPPEQVEHTLAFTAAKLGRRARATLVHHSEEHAIYVYHQRKER